MSKTREDLLISPGHPINSQNCWGAACSKADINIVAREEAMFIHWHQACGLLGSDKIAKALQQGYSLQIITTTPRKPSVCAFHTGPGSWNLILSCLHKPPPSVTLPPPCSPWPSMTFMNIQRIQTQTDALMKLYEPYKGAFWKEQQHNCLKLI